MKLQILRFTLCLLMCLTLPLTAMAQIINIPEPVPPPLTVRDAFDLDPFYQQWIDVEGLPVVASAKVNPYAVKEAAWLIEKMIGHRADVLRTMAGNKARFSVIAHTEIITEIPEYRGDPCPDFLVFRQRGWGGSEGATISSSEESILGYPGAHGRYNTVIHEFAHGIHFLGLKTLDPTFDERLKATYETAMAKGLWQGTYASSDRREYWADGTIAWFNPNSHASFYQFGNTRQALKAYDPELAALLTEVYGDYQWRYTPVTNRLHLPHLQGMNPQSFPTFENWTELETLYQQLNKPYSDGGGAWVNLERYDPQRLASLTKSNVVGAATCVIFVNLSRDDVLLYGVHSDGTEGYWTQVPPDFIRATSSRINELWVIKDSHGKNLAVFQAEEKTGRALIPTDIAAPVTSQVVSIPSAPLRAAIKTVLGKSSGAIITASDMGYLTHLDAENAGITDLTGLENAIYLRELHLWGNSVKDLSPLAALTKLTGLYLGGNSTSDLSPLVGLTNLESLFLDGNGISDLSPLAGLTKLTRLALNNNSVSDLTPLVGLTNLKWMRLAGNKISDLSPLVANTGLGSGDTVDVRGNPLSYLSLYVHIPALQSRGVDVQFDAGATRPPDVNNDGSVNILDLILIASDLGNEGQNLASDVSGDGVVSILDLVLAAGMFEEAAAAPSAHAQVPETLTTVEVQGWLIDARALQVRDPIMKRGFVVLEQLLVSLTPKETELLANYPNPFNPETWIPYRLAEDAFVTLTIYDLSGRVVRTLDVGHRIASAYENRSKAIYWDGRNDVGERVASGVFFYNLSAGKYSATRKMAILK